MEKFIEKLKRSQIPDTIEQKKELENEKVKAVNPCVACCITMGKEPHAGHMFLLAIAEQTRSASGSRLPIVVINNNTGPRAAGAVLQIAESMGLSVQDAVNKMDLGEFMLEEVVSAYRSRKSDEDMVETVMKILSDEEKDIFRVIAKETMLVLKDSGFVAEIVSESYLGKRAVNKTLNNNLAWRGSGFMPYLDKKRVVILQKSGNLTASGSLFTSINAITEITGSDLVLTVDSMPDVSDVTYVLNKSSTTGGVQVPGAGVGFCGRIASGTKGEALSISDISKRFYLLRPGGNLKNAVVYLTMTRPLSFPVDSLNIADSFFDFKDNDSLIELLLKCNDEVTEYEKVVANKLLGLEKRIGDRSVSGDGGVTKLLEFLPQRSKALLEIDPEKFVSESKKVDMITAGDRANVLIRELGYHSVSNSPYGRKERLLGIRRNSYFNSLNGLLKAIDRIDMISSNDLAIIKRMAGFCLERIGI